MKDNTNDQRGEAPRKTRQPGRPRAIPFELESTVMDLYKTGYGYRAIAGFLKKDYHINPDFSTVKRTLKRLGILSHHGSASKL